MVNENQKRIEEIKDFYNYYKEEIDDEIYHGWDLDSITKNLYYAEDNWNNGDISTGMYVHSKEDMYDLLEDTYQWLLTHEDRCSECGKLIDDDDYIVSSQNHPYGDGYATEYYNTGYVCPRCGYQEEW